MKRGLIATVAVMVALTGCTADPVITDSPAPSATVTATTEPAVTFPTTLSGYSTGLDCDDIAAAVAPTGSGYTVSNLLAGASVPADSIKVSNGIACGLENSSGEVILVGVAQLDAPANDAVKAYYQATAAESTAYDGSNPPDGIAYFDVTNGLGEANEFYTGYWFYAASKDYGKDTDATSLVNALWENFAPKA